MSSQFRIKIHPEPISPPASPERDGAIIPNLPIHHAQGEGLHVPPGLLFKENNIYFPINIHFWASISEDDWITGRYYNNSVHPIFNHRLKIVKVHLYTHRVVEMTRREIRDMQFYEPYSDSNNNSGEASTSAAHHHRNN